MKIIPTSFKSAASSENIFLALFEKQKLQDLEIFSYLPKSAKNAALELCKKEFEGTSGEIRSLWMAQGKIKRIKLFGLGERSKWNYRKEQLVPRIFVRHAQGEKIREFTACLPPSPTDAGTSAYRFAVNSLMAEFEFNKYKERPKTGWPEIKTITLAVADKNLSAARQGISDGRITGEETNLCRELTNTPGGDMTPMRLAEAAVVSAKNNGIHAKIFDEKEMARLGMGGVLGVARGSSEKPRFIILEYLRGPKDQKPLVLVGKGVTFDTGGLNLKPDEHIYEMHMDMSGGAAVIHGLAAIARLKLPVNAVGIIPAVENMPSGSSYHPGDLLRTMSGKTIEVLNTDAEGRVILSDANWYGATKYKPGLLADFATLTGAAHVAIGSYASAFFTREGDESLEHALIEVGKKSGDYVWPLPLWDEYLADIKGTFGDLANIGAKDRYGGAVHGAKFLEQFAKDARFTHIDIAPRMTSIDADYLAKGATGVGVRFIVELAKCYPQILNSKP